MNEKILLEAMAMMAENMQRLAAGESPAYSEQAFRALDAQLGQVQDDSVYDHACDVCAKRTPNVLTLCDDCDPTVDGKVAGNGSGVERLQAELDAARAEIERLKGTPDANGIKQCPFCGERGILSSSRLMWWVVTCESCGAECDDMPSRQEAVDMWNRRGGE